MVQLIRAGMNVARLNFSHGDFQTHRINIERLRQAQRLTEMPLAIMADLPGPKIRLGEIQSGPIQLNAGDRYTLTTREVVGDKSHASVTFEMLPRVVKPGDRLFLNDGLVQLIADRVTSTDVECTVAVGGEVSSRKGLNLPGIDLGISAFTEQDRECLEFAMEMGVDAVSQSFVGSAADIEAVRAAARENGHNPFVIAKIERATALDRYDEILEVSDGVMVARGDLGVEVPIERIASVQKWMIARANLAGKPVITATQMLESMVTSRLPTRAEATDVANAVLDGTDCLMLSGESAVGLFPVESVAMLARIAREAEADRPPIPPETRREMKQTGNLSSPRAAMALVVEHALRTVPSAAVFVPTRSGNTARMISRFKPTAWIVAPTRDQAVAQGLAFSYGVAPIHMEEELADWGDFIEEWIRDAGLSGTTAMLVTGPLSNQAANHRLEFLRIGEKK